jgi:hypothetical protein
MRTLHRKVLLFVYIQYMICNDSHSFTPFSSFQFAANGVCTRPHTFVSTITSENNNYNNHTATFSMRNVPGNGDCMFLAVALATLVSMGLECHDDTHTAHLWSMATELRAVVASILASPNQNLVIQNDRIVTARALLESAAAQEQLSTDDYLTALRHNLHGGGPELTVLSNILRRPICIYEAATAAQTTSSWKNENETEFSIQCQGTFGQGIFVDPLRTIPDTAALQLNWPLHILVVDSSPHEKHACVLIPIQ